MPRDVEAVTRIAFVDFMYAIVVGSAFGAVPPLELSFRFLGLLFLILVILEDFYLYHTQIVGRREAQVPSFSALVAEIAILLVWYLAVISFPDSPASCLLCFAAFFALKWLAGVAHFAKLAKLRSWEFRRNATFLVPMVVAVVIALTGGNRDLSFVGQWLPVTAAWVFHVTTWWGVTNHRSKAA